MASNTPARMPIVGGNWKMNTVRSSAIDLAAAVAGNGADVVEHCEIVVYPPFPYLEAVGGALGHQGVVLGAQDVYFETAGAFTGEVSTGMLLDLGCGMALAGHSERRHVLGEDDALVNAKARAALAAGLRVTLCVGELEDQRTGGRTEAVVLDQLAAGLDGIDAADMDRVVIAYEPVWAIGTGLAATPADAEAVHAFIREELGRRLGPDVAAATRIQYGGSVKPGNAAELFSQPNVDGFLVGGAALNADDFVSIVRATTPATQTAARKP